MGNRLTFSPTFTHDCDCCAFLAHVRPLDGRAFDLYLHGETILARTGSEGPDYSSFPRDFAARFEGDTSSTLGRAYFVEQLLHRRRFKAEAVPA